MKILVKQVIKLQIQVKVMHPKYYKHFFKGALQSHLGREWPIT